MHGVTVKNFHWNFDVESVLIFVVDVVVVVVVVVGGGGGGDGRLE